MSLIKKTQNKITSILSDEKSKGVIVNSIASIVIKGLAVVIGFFITPTYMRFFNDSPTLGLWFTLLSIFTWVLFFDLGLGNGLRNNLVKSFEKKDFEAVRSSISSTYVVISIIAIIGICIAIPVIRILDWNSIFQIGTNVISRETFITTMTLAFIGIFGQFALQTVSSIWYALHKTWVNNFTTLLIILIQFALIYFKENGTSEENLLFATFTYVVSTNGVLLGATLFLFLGKLKYAFPRIKFFNKTYLNSILKLGGMFFLIQIAWMLINSTNQFYISVTFDAASVVEYQIFYKLFFMIATFYSIAVTPIWSTVTKASVQNDVKWIKKANIAMFKLLGLFSLAAILLMLFMQPIVNLWLGDESIPVSFFNCLIFAIYTISFMLVITLTMTANGVGKVKIQAIFFSIFALIKYPLIYILSLIYPSWIGVVIVNIALLLVFSIVQGRWLFKFLRTPLTTGETSQMGSYEGGNL